MTFLFNWLCHQLFQIAGYITSFFSMLFNSIVQLIVYLFSCAYEWLCYSISFFIILALYAFDYFLQFVVYILTSTIGGDPFGFVGFSTVILENNMQSIITIAPYAKEIAYILNLDAAVDAFQAMITFMLFWIVYRWFRVWVRG